MTILTSAQSELNMDISESVLQLVELSTAIFDTSNAISAKINLIKNEIDSGKYRIHSAHIAAKLLEFAPEVKTKTRIEANLCSLA